MRKKLLILFALVGCCLGANAQYVQVSELEDGAEYFILNANEDNEVLPNRNFYWDYVNGGYNLRTRNTDKCTDVRFVAHAKVVEGVAYWSFQISSEELNDKYIGLWTSTGNIRTFDSEQLWTVSYDGSKQGFKLKVKEYQGDNTEMKMNGNKSWVVLRSNGSDGDTTSDTDCWRFYRYVNNVKWSFDANEWAFTGDGGRISQSNIRVDGNTIVLEGVNQKNNGCLKYGGDNTYLFENAAKTFIIKGRNISPIAEKNSLWFLNNNNDGAVSHHPCRVVTNGDITTLVWNIADLTDGMKNTVNHNNWRLITDDKTTLFGLSADHVNEDVVITDIQFGSEDSRLVTSPYTEIGDKIVNPSFENDNAKLTKVAPTGWSISETDLGWYGVNPGGGGGDPAATDGTYVFGVWDGSVKATSILQEITLSKGRYRLTVDMHASNVSDDNIRLGDQCVFAGENKGYFKNQALPGNGDQVAMQTIYTDFTIDNDDTSINIGASTDNAPNATWFKVDNFRLYKMTSASLYETETITGAELPNNSVQVELNRTFTANCWNTLVLPFDMTQDELQDWLGDDTKVAKYIRTDEIADHINIVFNVTDEDLSANTPYLVWPGEIPAEQIYTISGREFSYTANPTYTPAGAAFSFVGTYANGTTVPEDALFINTRNELKRSTGATTMKAFRGYFQSTGGVSSVKAISLFVDDSATGISEAVENSPKADTMYDLSGRKMVNGKLQKGVYIVNGHKVLVK